jgi:hypothetical protein
MQDESSDGNSDSKVSAALTDCDCSEVRRVNWLRTPSHPSGRLTECDWVCHYTTMCYPGVIDFVKRASPTPQPIRFSGHTSAQREKTVAHRLRYDQRYATRKMKSRRTSALINQPNELLHARPLLSCQRS